jgi:hypothetical protein
MLRVSSFFLQRSCSRCFRFATIFLALTRALLNSHFLSDVLVGAGTALITTREVLMQAFPALVRPWF